MPRFHENSNDEFRDDDEVYADFDDQPDNEDELTVVCSNCGFEMLEIVYQCPRCGEIPSREFGRTATRPRWVVFTALILLGLLLWWILL